MKATVIPESVIVELAKRGGPIAQMLLDEAAEIRQRGGVVRFLLTENNELCAQEGIDLNKKD